MKKVVSLLLGIASAMGCSASEADLEVSLQVSQDGVAEGGQVRIVSAYSGLALDVKGVSKSTGAPVYQWADVRGPNQHWSLRSMGDGSYSIVSSHSGKCLDVEGISQADGAKLHQWDCHGGANQRWKLVPAQDSSFELRSQHSGKCLTAGWDKNNGAELVQWGCWSDIKQRFRFEQLGGDKSTPSGAMDFKWSYAGPIQGMHCVKMEENSDPHTWKDNYLCSTRDLGLRWSSAGPISGMKCLAIDEPSDPHTWHDNYLCSPADLGLRWSYAGPISGMQCIACKEPSDPHAWNDNYLCWGRGSSNPDPSTSGGSSGTGNANACTPSSKVPKGKSYLDNGVVRIGVDLDRGAGVGHLESKAGGGNVLDSWDTGRYVQQSYYGDDRTGSWNGKPWTFNPVQGGSWDGDASPVVSFCNDGNTIYAKTLPLDWGDTGSTPTVMEEWIRLEGDLAQIRFRFEYKGNVQSKVRHQEVPAVFVRRDLERLSYYDGSSPWTGAGVSQFFPNMLETQGSSPLHFTESWLAYVNGQNWGVGIYSRPASQATSYRVGSIGAAGATSYFAFVEAFALKPGLVHDYTLYAKIGNLAEIRRSFATLRQNGK